MIIGLPKKLITAIVAVFCISQVSFSQDFDNPLAPKQEKTPIYLGPVIGYNRVIHSTNKPSIPIALDDIPCPNFENGSANGFFAGLSFEYMLGQSVNSKSSIILRALYNTFPSYFEQQGDDLPTTINRTDVNGNVYTDTTTTSINYLNDIDYNVISLDALYKFNFVQAGKLGFGVVVGGTFDYAIATDEINRMKLVSPENGQLIRSPEANERGWTYTNNDTELQFNDGEIPDAQAFRLGLKVGAQIEYSMSGVVIVPNIMYNLGLTDLSPDFDWRVSALQLGVDVRFAIK